MIKKEDIKYMAALSKLKCSEKELDELVEELSGRVDYAELLSQVDTDDVESTYDVNEHYQTLREDIAEEGLTREEVLQNSIEDQYGYFKILRIVE